MKKIQYITFMVLMLTAFCTEQTLAQAKKNSFYYSVDLGSGNIFTLLGASLISGGVNSIEPLAQNGGLINCAYLESPIKAYSGNTELDVNKFKFNEIKARDLFKDIMVGFRMGWQTDVSINFFNFGVYASYHYRVNQFEIKDPIESEFKTHGLHRSLIGLTTMYSFGDNTAAVRPIVELGIKYGIASKYENPYNYDAKDLKNGILSHFAVVFDMSYDKWLNDFGIFVDINHYNPFENIKPVTEMKTWTLGISFTVDFYQGAVTNRYGY